MSDNSSYNDNNVHFFEIPTDSDNSEFIFTIRYAAKSKEGGKASTTGGESEEEAEEDPSAQIAKEEENRSIPERADTSLHESSIVLISLTISTVMMMAARMTNIPHNYLIWAHKYLKCCKDRNGELPPNIQEILDILEKERDFEYVDQPQCRCPRFYHK